MRGASGSCDIGKGVAVTLLVSECEMRQEAVELGIAAIKLMSLVAFAELADFNLHS